jgi:hypothetical protein
MPYRGKGAKKIKEKALQEAFAEYAEAADKALKIPGNDTEENREFARRLHGMAGDVAGNTTR